MHNGIIIYSNNKQKFEKYVMGIDIGGTNTNIGFAGVSNIKIELLFSLNFESKKLNSLIPVIIKSLEYAKKNYNIEPKLACIGAPGIVSPSNDLAKLTNLKWDVNSREIKNKTELNSIYIINDFQAIGFGINLLDSNSNDLLYIRKIKENNETKKLNKALIGAGTGFGKCVLIYDERYDSYIPIASEGGHGDLPIKDDYEFELIDYIKKSRNIKEPIYYEEVLSGRGIQNIYDFLREKKDYRNTIYTEEIDNNIDKTPLISKYKNLDDTCKETFNIFTKFYARCAKNFVLDVHAKGGLYIAGGIAAKNREIFSSKMFIDEFENSYRRKDFLRETPIGIILNYDLSLYGACYAAMYKKFQDL